ncbi:hypothetical protein H4582DRAFT_106151 [Lactarius indigo]|nr:hypothetical protein H4582DRAFT_106151 [Lactarius indigo]
MLFRRLIAAVASVAFISQGALAALTPQQIVTNIGIVTQVSRDANDALTPLSTTPPPQLPAIVPNIAKKLADDFQIIISNITADIDAMQATLPFVDCPAAALVIVAALKDFVTVHQVLLSTVISKHSYFAQFAVTSPILAALRALEKIIDKFALSMIDLISCSIGPVTQDQDDLDKSVGDTIKRYEQFCIPSPLYPIVKPICL